MAGEKGLEYENKIRTRMIEHGFVDDNLEVGGFSATSTDGYFFHEKIKYDLEIKNDYGSGVSKADYGQIALQFNMVTKEFLITSGKTATKGDQNIKKRIFEKSDFLDVINNDWKGTPLRELFRAKLKKELTKADFEADKQQYQSSWVKYPIDFIHEYYENEGDYYIQINGLGFFCLTEDPAGLGVPQLEGVSLFRSRRKTHSSRADSKGNYKSYSFQIAIKLADPIQSDFDLMDCNRLPPIKPEYSIKCPTCKNKKWW